MKRYLAFAMETYYPNGGWDDCCGDFDSLPDAVAAASWADDWHVVDTRRGWPGKIVAAKGTGKLPRRGQLIEALEREAEMDAEARKG